ncbi:MAG: 3-keto-5-aminohexanoate cleavage protein [Verrucomicrobia bacterium]|nr:3-keto-5-aminohexanoate cleavage protein [Verrucomicrobiota bacterium]
MIKRKLSPCEDAMLLKAAINGRRSLRDHPGIPINPRQQAHHAMLAVAAGARGHPRPSTQYEWPGEPPVRRCRRCALGAIRAACPGTPIGVSTGAWIVPEIGARLTLISEWDILPDFAAVNFHEVGAVQVALLLLEKGIALEAGIWNAEAARLFRQSGLSDRCLRILIEPAEEPGNARDRLDEIESCLQEIRCPRLLHGFEASTWEFIALASRRGYDTRVGFEDTVALPQGCRAKDNGELVAEAWRIARSAVTIRSPAPQF